MTYAVIFTRNDGWTGVTTIEAMKPTYDEAMVEAEKQVKDIMKTQHIKGSVQDNIKNGEIEFEDSDFFDSRIKANFVFPKSKLEVLIQELP
jgi:hypothetical protein